MAPDNRRAAACVLKSMLEGGFVQLEALGQAINDSDSCRAVSHLLSRSVSSLTGQWIADVAQHFPARVRRQLAAQSAFGVILTTDSVGAPYWFLELASPYVVAIKALKTLPTAASRRVVSILNLTSRLAMPMGEIFDHYHADGPAHWLNQMALDCLAQIDQEGGPLTVERITESVEASDYLLDVPSDPEYIAPLLELYECVKAGPPEAVRSLSGDPKAVQDRMARWVRDSGQAMLSGSPWLHFIENGIDLLRMARKGELWPQIDSVNQYRDIRHDHHDPAFLLGVIEHDNPVQQHTLDDYYEMVQQTGEAVGIELDCPDTHPLLPLEVAVRKAAFTLGILNLTFLTDE